MLGSLQGFHISLAVWVTPSTHACIEGSGPGARTCASCTRKHTSATKPPPSAPVHVLASLRLRRHLSAAGGEDASICAEDSGLLKQISVLRGDGSPPFQFQKLI